MGLVGLRLRLCFFFVMVIIAADAARNTISLSDDKVEAVMVAVEMTQVHGRSLKLSLNDYSDPSANHGHDPKNKGGSSGGSGHKGHGDTTP